MSNLTKQEIDNLNQLKNDYYLDDDDLRSIIILLQELLIEATSRELGRYN